MSRKHMVGLALSAVAIMFVAACQAFSAGAIDVPNRGSAQATDQQLFEAVARTRSVNAKLVVRLGEDSIAGGHDSKTAAAGYRHGTGAEVVATADTTYVRNVPGVPDGRWAKMITAQMAASCRLAAVSDPRFALSLVQAATSVEPSGDLSYRGVSDLARVKGAVATMKNAEYFAAIMADGRTEVPFTATVDRAGYVVSVTAAFPTRSGDFEYSLGLSSFGGSIRVSIPTDAVEAPPELYR